MPTSLTLRPLTDDERRPIERLAHARTAPAWLVERAQMLRRAHQGARVSAIARVLGIDQETVRRWRKRCNAGGLDDLADEPRSGRPATDPAAEVSTGVATGLTDPAALPLPFGSWTLDRLADLPARAEGTDHESQPDRSDPAAGRLAPAHPGDLVRRAARPGLRRKKGAIVTLSEAPPAGSVVICLDERGPERGKRHLGVRVVRPAPTGEKRRRTRQEIDDGRAGAGYRFGAFAPATGAAFTAP